MRVETTTRNIYTWDELNDEQQEKAIEKLWDLNVDYDWWDGVYEDASSVGLTISGFDLGRAMKCDVELDWSGLNVANKILELHGPNCDTYKSAEKYVARYMAALIDNVGLVPGEEIEVQTDWMDDDFRKELSVDYFHILQNEYDYLTSREAIIESIESNEYEFEEDGSLI